MLILSIRWYPLLAFTTIIAGVRSGTPFAITDIGDIGTFMDTFTGIIITRVITRVIWSALLKSLDCRRENGVHYRSTSVHVDCLAGNKTRFILA